MLELIPVPAPMTGKRVEVPAEQRDVVHPEAATNDGPVIVKRPIGEAEPRHEALGGNVAETGGKTCL